MKYLEEERLTKGTYHKDEPTLRVLSLGAGVQSSALLLMMKNRKIKPADVAIFSDTGNEPPEVYEHLEFLEEISPIPIHKVSYGHITNDILNDRFDGYIKIPFHIRKKDGKMGIGMRQCTKDYKITPIHQEIRRILDRQRLRYTSIEIVMGISKDEQTRMAYPEKEWGIHCYPLVFNNITREDCIEYWENEFNKKPPRSACIVCPYRKDEDWKIMKETRPKQFAEAVEFDYFIRDKSMTGVKSYISWHGLPLDKVNFNEKQDQKVYEEECEGYCGF